MELNKLKSIVVELLHPCDLVALGILCCLGLILGGEACIIAHTCLVVILIILSLITNLVVSTHIEVLIFGNGDRLLGAYAADFNNSLKSAVVVE